MAAISIPVLIHLWNVRPGKTLKVGSIVLIEASSRKRSRSFKLLDILLLLLRCLLLIAAAFVLAMPFFKQKSIDSSKGWLLIPKEDFKEAYQKFKPKADSLLKVGYELHYFNDGFAKTAIQQALGDTSLSNISSTASYWDLLSQLNLLVPTPQNVYLITPGLLNKFAGERPSISLKLNWETYIPADSIETHIQKAWFTADKNIYVVTATSHPASTTFRYENLAPTTINSSPFVLNAAAGKATIGLKNKNQASIEIDTTSLKIDVFADANQQDARYVEAALQAVQQFTLRNIKVESYNKNSSDVKDWLFWLSDKPPGNEVLNHYQNVLVYDDGRKTAAVNTIMSAGDENSGTIALYKSVAPNTNNGSSKWHDGYGNPILRAETKGKTTLYQLYTRFNPAWNNLVWDAAFPQLIQQLIVPSGENQNNLLYDKRRIDIKQIQPNFITSSSISVNYTSTTNLTHYFWLLLILLFIAERWLAHKKAEGATG